MTHTRRLVLVATAVGAMAASAGIMAGASAWATASARPLASSSAGLYLESTGPSLGGPSTGRIGAQDLIGFSWGAKAADSVSRTGPVASRALPRALTVQFFDSQVSPLFLTALGTGSKFSTLSVVVSKNAGPVVIDSEFIELSDAHAASISISSSGGTFPTETVTFVYRAIKETYLPQRPDGSLGAPVVATWNFALNNTTFP